jgi:DNA-binding HxlR family transcriptional regulator
MFFIVKAYTGPMPKRYGQACPVAQALGFLGERWTLLVIRDLLIRPRKFQDLRESLSGVTPAVLSNRLKLLEGRGIVARRLYTEHPPRAEYALTTRGLELRSVVRALGIWGSRHLDAGWTFVHDACDTDVEIAYRCPSCRKTITADHVRRRPRRVRQSARRARTSGVSSPTASAS